MKYKVSVIVPIYNVGKYIGRCVDTLMRQTLKEIEYIFVDDCAQDDSYAVLMDTLARYPERAADVKILRHSVNQGLTQTRTDGLELATGEFITHCDSDDWTDERMYELMYEKAVSESAEAVLCDYFFAYSDRNKLHRNHFICDKDKTTLLKSYLREEWNTVWSAIVSRDVYERSGYRPPVGITFTEDFHLMVRLLHESRKTVCISEPLYYYHQTNTASITKTLNIVKLNDELRCYEQIQEWMKEKGIDQELKKEMAWRFLKAKQYFVSYNLFDKFRSSHPSSNRYFLSLPASFSPFKVRVKMILTILQLDFICRWDNHLHGRY